MNKKPATQKANTKYPDYFIALVKQHGNMHSDQRAAAVVDAVSNCLVACLPADQSMRLIAALPEYLRPRQQQFFSRITHRKETGATPSSIVPRLQRALTLTDESEVATILAAYFKALKVVLEPAKAIKFRDNLPPRLAYLYTLV